MSKNIKSTTIQMIGNAHLDPVWLWRWTEGYEALVATFRSALNLLKVNPTFIFTSSSASMYAWIEENEPALFREIQHQVKKGRWHLVGGWWIQPDCNIPAGESLVRQALYGQNYFQKKFGVTCTIGYNVDTFGHPATLPQILAGAGLQYYIFFRPGPHEKKLSEDLFYWESPDGTRVLAHRPPGHYTYSEDDPVPIIKEHLTQQVHGLREVLSFYGVGNHGGGPTQKLITSIQAANHDKTLPRITCSTIEHFFQRALKQRRNFPVLKDELQHHSRGCYSTHAGVKRWNQESEVLLETTEYYSTLASIALSIPYPKKALTHAWQNVLFNQFHDILAGTSLPKAYSDARDLYGEANLLANKSLWQSLQSICRNVHTMGDGSAVMAFNPLPWRTELPIQLCVPISPDSKKSKVILRADGQEIPYQMVQSTVVTRNRSEQFLWLDTLPALGYQLYFIKDTNRFKKYPTTDLKIGKNFLENRYWRITIHPTHGYITSLWDKTLNWEVCSGPAAVPLVIKDDSDTWGHDIEKYRDVIGRFGKASITIEESGSLRCALRVKTNYHNSTITQLFQLYRNSKRIEVKMDIDWHEEFRMLKLAIPVNVIRSKVTSSIPYGYISRKSTGNEEPCGPWVDLTGKAKNGTKDFNYGMTVVTDSKHGYDVSDSEIRISVLRSPIYAWHDPAKPKRGSTYQFMEQGRSTLRYFLLPHAESWQKAKIVRQAIEINRPTIIVNEYAHKGNLPPAWSGVEVGPDNIVLTVLKGAEDGKGIILRLWETIGQSTKSWIAFPCLKYKWQGLLKANEIKTIRIYKKQNQWIGEEADFLECKITR